MNIIPNLIERIVFLDTNAIVTVRGDDYDTIEWHVGNVNPGPPSAADCLAVDIVKAREKQFEANLKAAIKSDPIKAQAFKAYKDANPGNNLKNFIEDMKTFQDTV